MKSTLPGLTRVLEQLLAIVLFGMFALVTILVVLRYVFATTIIGGNEATVIAFIFTTAIGASVAIARDEHIAIDYFVLKLPKALQRKISVLRLLLLILINAAILLYAFDWIERTGGFLMPTLGVPQILAQISVPIGCVLSIVYCVARIFQR
ncbi:MAG: TRAP-type C4-dicarboxylate transport system permease small subunit [Halieaceae bacterium]|jgi:TRAP-type C4-dicarboxylate transport system permease small subunit